MYSREQQLEDLLKEAVEYLEDYLTYFHEDDMEPLRTLVKYIKEQLQCVRN